MNSIKFSNWPQFVNLFLKTYLYMSNEWSLLLWLEQNMQLLQFSNSLVQISVGICNDRNESAPSNHLVLKVSTLWDPTLSHGSDRNEPSGYDGVWKWISLIQTSRSIAENPVLFAEIVNWWDWLWRHWTWSKLRIKIKLIFLTTN